MTKYYDAINNRLVFIESGANSDHWDKHWDVKNFDESVKTPNNSFVINQTKKYLPVGSRILEGGCGKGDKVYALNFNGFDSYGVDYAQKTVRKINNCAPQLKVTLGDVRLLNFKDDYFDGYWSLGVIEHFFNGYDDIAKEMFRTLKSKSYLFMTVPSMSPLRKLKALLKLYPKFNYSEKIEDNFYQFALTPESIINHFSSLGFELVKYKPYDGVKGLKDEISLLKPILQPCYDSNNILCKIIRKLINSSIGWFSGHMTFYIFKKI